MELLFYTLICLLTFFLGYFVGFLLCFGRRFIKCRNIMSANNDFAMFVENHDESLMLDAMSFIFGSNSWARMMAAGACTWADRSPPQGSVALQWWYPFNIAMPGVSVTTLSGYRSFKVVRQNTSGELVPVNVEVHCETGAARIKSVDTQLAQMDPGFMVPMPRFLCLVFDWLWFSWEERTGQDQQSLFVDEDGLFEDDRAVHQTLLRSRYARFHRLDTVVSHLEPSASRESVGNVQERESGHDSVENGGTSGAVRVSSGSSTGPEAGEIHRAALARHRYPGRAGGRPSFMDMDDASSDGADSSDSDFVEA